MKSTIKSDHSALVVYYGEEVRVNENKKSKVVNFQKKSPSINARFLASMDDQSFIDVMERDDVQTVYSILTILLKESLSLIRIPAL